jgi:hypothetical protein
MIFKYLKYLHNYDCKIVIWLKFVAVVKYFKKFWRWISNDKRHALFLDMSSVSQRDDHISVN